MSKTNAPMSSQFWMSQIFAAKAARDGRIVRDVERIVGQHAFKSDMKRRGFTVVENAGQYVIFCNHGSLRRVV